MQKKNIHLAFDVFFVLLFAVLGACSTASEEGSEFGDNSQNSALNFVETPVDTSDCIPEAATQTMACGVYVNTQRYDTPLSSFGEACAEPRKTLQLVVTRRRYEDIYNEDGYGMNKAFGAANSHAFSTTTTPPVVANGFATDSVTFTYEGPGNETYSTAGVVIPFNTGVQNWGDLTIIARTSPCTFPGEVYSADLDGAHYVIRQTRDHRADMLLTLPQMTCPSGQYEKLEIWIRNNSDSYKISDVAEYTAGGQVLGLAVLDAQANGGTDNTAIPGNKNDITSLHLIFPWSGVTNQPPVSFTKVVNSCVN